MPIWSWISVPDGVKADFTGVIGKEVKIGNSYGFVQVAVGGKVLVNCAGLLGKKVKIGNGYYAVCVHIAGKEGKYAGCHIGLLLIAGCLCGGSGKIKAGIGWVIYCVVAHNRQMIAVAHNNAVGRVGCQPANMQPHSV